MEVTKIKKKYVTPLGCWSTTVIYRLFHLCRLKASVTGGDVIQFSILHEEYVRYYIGVGSILHTTAVSLMTAFTDFVRLSALCF